MVGKKRMKCPHCGTENVNDMLVEFEWDTIPVVRDTTTLPKFLHYLRYPKDVGRMPGSKDLPFPLSPIEPKDGHPKKIIRIYCDKCNLALGRGDLIEQKEIKPTRFGV